MMKMDSGKLWFLLLLAAFYLTILCSAEHDQGHDHDHSCNCTMPCNCSMHDGNMTHHHHHDNMTAMRPHHGSQPHDPVHMFQCSSETAVHISKGKLCDGQEDCPDNSDENEQTCLEEAHRCLPGRHKCGDSNACVNHDSMCNGEKDCPDGWDETKHAGCASYHMPKNDTEACPDMYSPCDKPFSRCILNSDKCNYRIDCENGEDENDCEEGKKCPDGMFHCFKTGPEEELFYYHCIAKELVCNKMPNCRYGEDEHHCGEKHDGHDNMHHPDKDMMDKPEKQMDGSAVRSLPSYVITAVPFIFKLIHH